MTASPLDGFLPDFGGRQDCTGLDPDLFFPDAPGQEQFRAREVAALCGSCPVRDACLEYALANNVVGVWAGTTTAERRDLRRRAGISANQQQRRSARSRQTVAELARKGFTSEQIIAHTGLNEQTVYRVLRKVHTGRDRVA